MQPGMPRHTLFKLHQLEPQNRRGGLAHPEEAFQPTPFYPPASLSQLFLLVASSMSRSIRPRLTDSPLRTLCCCSRSAKACRKVQGPAKVSTSRGVVSWQCQLWQKQQQG